MKEKVDVNLSSYNNSWYHPGKNFLVRSFWFFVNAIFFQSRLVHNNFLKILILRSFGAKVGNGVFIKPSVNIKYPWLLKIGNFVWIGENVWIDNLALVEIGNNVCISQGAMLLTGNHDYTKVTFDLMVKGIAIEDGVWVGAKAIVCPGVTCGSHSVLSVGSVASNNLNPNEIYQGNPAISVKQRSIAS
jgi:putative colanic acid biosynthesis acetyltransferase WcaF